MGANLQITSLLDRDFDGVAEISCTLLTGLQNPNGIVWHKGSLYVAETEKLTRFDGIDFAVLNGCNSSLVRSKLLTPFPPQTTHGFRALALGPDEKLYVSIAAPFNIGECKDMFCTLQRLDLNGSGMETFARGIRNVGGIAWSDHPELPGTFFSVVERDLMGPDRPDDNIVMATEEGDFWGFPFCHWIGNGDPHDRAPGPGEPFSDDQQVAPGLNNATLHTNDTQGPWCAENVRTPVQALGAHVSPLAIAFYPSSPEGLPAQEGGPWRQQLWPEEYWGRLFVAEHGSWNRDPPIGYRLAAVEVSLDGVSTGHEVFVDGWLQDFGPSNRSVWATNGALVDPRLAEILQHIAVGIIKPEDAAVQLNQLVANGAKEQVTNVEAVGLAKAEFPEVIWGQTKSAQHIAATLQRVADRQGMAAATRVDPDVAAGKPHSLEVQVVLPDVQYNSTARMLSYRSPTTKQEKLPGTVALITAGTADPRVVEECRLMLQSMGCYSFKLAESGVMGIHRLVQNLDAVRAADVVVVITGYDGGIASMVAGLVEAPVVVLPTSTGYGAAFHGVSPLLAALNSSAPGVTVVNIDSGFGASMAAWRILKNISKLRKAIAAQRQ
ncbi:hypothetical protein N2152v2_007113 [Parachlorella kessleri]